MGDKQAIQLLAKERKQAKIRTCFLPIRILKAILTTLSNPAMSLAVERVRPRLDLVYDGAVVLHL